MIGRVEDADRPLSKGLRKIARPLERRGHCSELIETVPRPSTEIIEEEERLVVVDHLRNVERTARSEAETVVGVGGLLESLSGQRVRTRVERGIPNGQR